jgi:cell pole-organizing protein PopZ
MLKAWLDENLEGVVRKAVEVEVERVSRLAR